MAVIPIVTFDDPVLRKKALPVEEHTEEIQKLINDMFQTMYHANGVGLAAPQIGKLLRIFVVDADMMTSEENGEKYGPIAFINPEIVELSGDKVKMEEGCLSIPEVRDEISRPSDVKVQYLDKNFEKQELKADGWLSRVIQHEYDHLEGVLFLDHLSAFRRRLHRSTLKKIDSGKLETEYPLVPKAESTKA